MSENIINIKIRLTGVEAFAKTLRGTGANIAQFGREISRIGQTVAWTGAAITGPLVLAFKNAEKYSLPVRQELERLKNAMLGFQVSIANALLPTAHQLTNFLGRLLNAWNSLSPAVQQSISQAVAWVGIWLLVGGTLTTITGKIVTLVGNIIKMGGSLLQFAAIHPVLLAVAGAIAVVVYLMMKFQGVTTTLNNIEIGFNAISISVIKVRDFFISLYDVLLKVQEKFNGVLSKFGINVEKNAKKVAEIRAELARLKESGSSDIRALEQRIADLMGGTKGNLALTVEEIQRVFDALKQNVDVKIPQIGEQIDQLFEMAQKVAGQMSKSFGDLFFNVITGQVKNLKEVFADFGRSLMQILAQALARFILIKSLGVMFPKLIPFFHQGGVVRAHSGMLAKDEVPIIAQTGERVLSRRQNKAYEKMMSGGGVGGANITNQPVLVIQAWDASDIFKNRKAIEAIMSNSLRSNSDFRGDVKRYG